MRTTSDIEKWTAVVSKNDIFIFQAKFRETAKQLRHISGDETAVGFKGTTMSHRALLHCNIVFDKNNSKFHDTYESARNHVAKVLETKKQLACYELEKAQALEDLFNSVPYVKR